MLEKPKDQTQGSLFFSLESTLNHRHPLFILSHKVDWDMFEKAFSPLYCCDNGRPAKPVRLMVGLLILKHVRNLSDESVVEQWSENIYYQYFCGQQEFLPVEPCASSELVHFRHRIGEEGIELILKESIRINGKDGDDQDVYFDTTVQEKNITFPTDDKLTKKIIKKCLKIAEENNLQLRQTYRRTLKKLSYDQRFRNHPKNKGKAKKADRKVKTIAGRLVRDVERKLGKMALDYQAALELFKRVLAQKRNDKDKIYSLHEPEVCCISKGKEHKPYEFGNKVSVGWTASGVIVGALGFRNEYDGHTLDRSIEQVERMRKSPPKNGIADRGYRGKSKVRETVIHIPKAFSKKLSLHMQRKEKKYFCKRAGIEPVISHLKADHRLSRNFYKGIFGDNINIILAAAGFNFKRMMNKWKTSFFLFLEQLFLTIIMTTNLIDGKYNIKYESK
ncbi:MAG: IS5 family transposase [Bacteroidia bacterium]|nr:IS5 family transposase [Bacteroidia bacterium]